MKKFTLLCAAAVAAMGMNAQETALTAEMWHQWTGWDADATVIEGAESGCDDNIGKELGQMDMVLGPQSCNGDLYADLTEYAGIEGVATPGITLRFYLNRQELQGPGVDLKINTDEEGKFTLNFSDNSDLVNAGFVHVNFIKIAAVWQGGQWPEGLEKCVVESMNLIKKEAVGLNAGMWHQWTGWSADATVIEGAETGCDDNIGKELGQMDMVLGPQSCNGDLYADLTEYAGIEGVATPGITLRFFLNRQELQGPGVDIKINTDEEGKFTLNFSDNSDLVNAGFVHVNFIKIAAVWQGGQWPEGLEKCVVESMNLIAKSGSEDPGEPEPADPYAITGNWFHQWDGFDASATVINENVGVEDNIGEELGVGNVVLGTGSVYGDIYADLTEYAGIEAEGTAGLTLRLLFNRPTQDSGITECNPTFDENGKFTFMFTEVKDGGNPATFIHLNAVKMPWGFPEGVSAATVTKFNVIEKQSDPSAVEAIENAETSVLYNVYGQRVDNSYRGIVIKNGKKYINK